MWVNQNNRVTLFSNYLLYFWFLLLKLFASSSVNISGTFAVADIFTESNYPTVIGIWPKCSRESDKQLFFFKALKISATVIRPTSLSVKDNYCYSNPE